MISIYDVLKASKGIHVDDTFAELWGRKLSNAYTVATYTGTLPATLRTVRGYLVSYKIYGNAIQAGTPTPENPIIPSGCGERTENLFDKGSDVVWYYIASDSGMWKRTGSTSRSIIIKCEPNTTYTIFVPTNRTLRAVYFDNYPSEGDIGYGYTNNTTWDYINKTMTITTNSSAQYLAFFCYNSTQEAAMYDEAEYFSQIMLNLGSTALPYEPYGYKLPMLSNSAATDIYIGDKSLVKDEYVDSSTGKIYRRTKNLSPPEEEWVDGQIGGGDGTVHPSTQIKVSPFIDVSTCETCIMEVFSAETEWAAAGYREMAFYDENKQYLGWIGGGGRQTLTPNSSERLSEFPAGTVYVRIGCSHGDQPFYPQLVSGYTPVHQFYPYLVPTDPPAPFPQIPTFAGTTAIDYNGSPKPEKVELTYRKRKGQ